MTGGCAVFRQETSLSVPPNLDAAPGVAEFGAGKNRTEALKQMYPPIHRFSTHARVTARRRVLLFFHAEKTLDINLIADEQKKVRLQGNLIGTQKTLFDLIADGNRMSVSIPPRIFLQGDFSSKGSPFGKNLGVEPWDLAEVLTAGPQIAATNSVWQVGGNTIRLRFEEEASNPNGLQSAEIDAATGLPRKAEWKRGRSTWTAQFLEWTVHRNTADDDQAWLIPSRFIIFSKKPRVSLEVALRKENDHCALNVNPEVLYAGTFRLVPRPGATVHPLDALEQVFRGL